MKNKKGFTLVELLAVIAILAILVIISLPNVIGMFNEAKKNSFVTELRNIYKIAGQQWINDSLFETAERTYSRCETCTGKSLQLSGRQNLDYYVVINKAGEVTKFYATDGTFQYSYIGKLLPTDITDAELVADLEEDEVLTITNNTAYTGDGPGPVSFATDSWETIAKAVRDNNTSMYNVGDTKTIDLAGYGTHTVRIANKSTPSECSNAEHSKTACGFVIEFADVITNHRMNPFDQGGHVNGDGNMGGWEYSEIRQFVNNEIYNSLPSELKNVIIDTYVVSGYSNSDTSVFKTTDKLYYFSHREIGGGTVYSNIKDSGYSHQLDLYVAYNGNHAMAIKKMNGTASNWCLRTPPYYTSGRIYYNVFYGIRASDGFIDQYGACSGVSPAFRIG